MEKSIELVWKEGFLESKALVAPKLNNLYNKKSEHIIDKFNRMFKINLKSIVVGSFIVLMASYFVNIPYLGILMFIILNGLVYVNQKLLKSLKKIDKNVSSYQYIKSFDTWMNLQLSTNKKIARIMYPLIFIAIIIGYWFGSFGGDIPGQEMVNLFLLEFPDTYLLFGIPAIWLGGALTFILLLVAFGGKIYTWDVNIVYGRVLKKLDEILSDMEELKRQ